MLKFDNIKPYDVQDFQCESVELNTNHDIGKSFCIDIDIDIDIHVHKPLKFLG